MVICPKCKQADHAPEMHLCPVEYEELQEQAKRLAADNKSLMVANDRLRSEHELLKRENADLSIRLRSAENVKANTEDAIKKLRADTPPPGCIRPAVGEEEKTMNCMTCKWPVSHCACYVQRIRGEAAQYRATTTHPTASSPADPERQDPTGIP